jgi:hypothetical protein
MELKIERVRHEGNLFKVYGSIQKQSLYDSPIRIYEPEAGYIDYANMISGHYKATFDIDFDDRNFAIINVHSFRFNFSTGMEDEQQVSEEFRQALPFLIQEKRIELISGIYPTLSEHEQLKKEIDRIMDEKAKELGNWHIEMIKAMINRGK